MQLETRQSRKVFYLPEGAMQDGRVEAHILSDDFRVLERMLR